MWNSNSNSNPHSNPNPISISNTNSNWNPNSNSNLELELELEPELDLQVDLELKLKMRPAEDEFAPLQQAPGSLHVETWAGCKQSLSLKISQEKEIPPRRAVPVFSPLPPFFAPVLPGPGREIWSTMGWTQL